MDTVDRLRSLLASIARAPAGACRRLEPMEARQLMSGDARSADGTGTTVINLDRSEFDPATGTSAKNPRQQVNDVTSWIDGSSVYGSDAARAAALRTFAGGKLKTSAGNLMPLNTAGLANAFFNPQVVKDAGIDPFLKYLASDNAQEVDTQVVDGVRNFLFGPPGAGGLDLVSLNVQRGRDHGLAEDHVAGTSVGPLIRRILADQFQRVRDGDRFWYQSTLRGAQLSAVEHTSLADIVRRNTTLTNLQDDVFTFDVTIAGRVFNSAASRTSPWRQSLAGFTIQLQDPDGNVLQTTTTRADGSYQFSGLGLGTYRVREVPKAGWRQTTADPADLKATRGMTISKVNFGNVIVPSSSTAAVALPSPFTAARIRHTDLKSDGGLLSDGGGVLAA